MAFHCQNGFIQSVDEQNGYEKVGKKRMDDNESKMPLKKI